VAEFAHPLLRAWAPTCHQATKALIEQHLTTQAYALSTPALMLLYLSGQKGPPGEDCARLGDAINDELDLLNKVRKVVAGPPPCFRPKPGISQDTATVMALHTVLGVDRG
jgi:hypothetical protein